MSKILQMDDVQVGQLVVINSHEQVEQIPGPTLFQTSTVVARRKPSWPEPLVVVAIDLPIVRLVSVGPMGEAYPGGSLNDLRATTLATIKEEMLDDKQRAALAQVRKRITATA